MLLYGASGHAKVIIDILINLGISIDAIFDDNPEKKEVAGLPVIGAYNEDHNPEMEIVISIGDNIIRKQISELIGHDFGRIISRHAIVSQSSKIDRGTAIFHGAVVQSGSHIGKHVIINTKASIDHDNIISDFCHIAPNATLCGGITIGEGTLVGAGSVINPNLKVGKWSVIGSGSVVINDIPDKCVAYGNPARIIRKIK